ncbi:hypothetical protein BZB76_1820 [Actinomadura pelletieri DSM 43383]|uniref:DUF8094 domain-containing protein n=1 Tax=Actinomadura pelletieri DSM 43383 TaxID=1120940 RepID=A0A495QSI1_9ACTN|nr:hypothetical protein [Actinomadura pelletieri]RKS76465.1 hypothetical protein BZB76_1820 [Actinomadura pelletieri DSM 43383]
MAVAGLLLALMTMLAGCATGGTKARPTTATPTMSPPEPEPVALTPQVAERAFRTYVTDEDVARAAGDERLALTWTSDGQSQLTAAEFRKAAYDGDPVRRFVYGEPKLYVPKLKDAAYPQWFMVSVDRSVLGKSKSKRRALMGFILRGPSDHWKLAIASLLQPKADEPKVVTDKDGYATALGSDDTSVLIRPRDVGGIQATIAAEGGRSVAAKVMRSGDVTTGYYRAAKRAKKQAKGKDLTLQIVYTATPFPYFGVRTEGGGGLIIYSLFRNTSLVAEDPGTPKPEIPEEAEHLLDGTVEGNRVDTASTLHFVAFDPPRVEKGKSQPKARVIGDDGAMTDANTPPLKKP